MGRPRKNIDDRRTKPVGFRCTHAEYHLLADAAGKAGLTIGEYCRLVALRREIPNPPPPVPKINREAWFVLSQANWNLHRAVQFIRDSGFQGDSIDLLIAELSRFRLALLGVRFDSEY